MKRKLLIMRHAKSDWSQDCGDFDRPLNKRGIRSAKKMGCWLKEQGSEPQCILTSPAKRAQQTAKIFCQHADLEVSLIQTEEAIYFGTVKDLYRVLRQISDKLEVILVIGHNPELEIFLQSLAVNRIDIPDDGKLLPTATIAQIAIQPPWSQLSENQGRLSTITRPRTLD